ncbi:MAG: thioredoxin family protein [Candidatus Obscuribacter sp.]|jgi:hypothetical protein|nr:thioredoxin family protein [Candidatus Obscuribacter sp.]MBK9203870.1 thioredoxin family protein [Candidatus Obscuribacter sp.]MBK9622460.1 thioredoxin family protein [Candidatus Obscuribacter sp.]MBL0187621.1 thioredoxin family protein [Candidatus Obscuribacter sp.]MDQ5968214.1 hypothetical protein [Cyanobacteriota bacterium erpe_2018_sw_39hr_WHONDRS-SW48-000098_B_bin.30]
MSAPGLLAAGAKPLSLREAAEQPAKRDVQDSSFSNLLEESTRSFGVDKPREPKLEFSSDLKSAIDEAKTTGKPMVLLLTSRDCAWCDALNKELTDPRLKEMQNRAVFLKLDVNDDPNSPGRIMFNALGAKGFPTTSILNIDANGGIKETKRLNGYYSTGELKTTFNEALPGPRVLLAENKDNIRRS